jgi:AGCS family alanine or glycine:cation symporter
MEKLAMELKNILELFNQWFTLYAIFPGILGLGLYLTIKLRFVQISQLKRSFSCLTQSNHESEGNTSRFKTLTAVLAGNFGTGNISGMAVAIAAGGPGALVWMWLMAFFGASIQYASCLLGVSFRTKTASGEYVGGPMYYLRDGLGQKALATAFAVFAICGAITVGNFAQTNSLILPLEKMGFNPLYCSLVIAFCVGIVVLGGIKRLANFASWIVPFKALLYLGTAFVIVAWHYDQVLPALKLMFQSAAGFAPLAGGVAGFSVLKALTTGFDRGLFATDAGTGIVPILQASARSEHPVMDGIASLIAPFLVMVVCTTTGLVLILTDAWLQTDLKSTNMVTFAFTKGLGSPIGGYIVMIALLLFAYTTIIAWAYCGEKAMEFIVGHGRANWFRYVYILLVPVGSILQVEMIWTLADISITLMLFINIIAVTALSGYVVGLSREFRQDKAVA